jgi:hypothetical protein
MEFVMTRGPDLVRAGVRLIGFSVSAGVAHAGDGARIVLVLPPQHIAEEMRGDAAPSDWVAQRALSATSQVAFAVAAGTAVGLTADGVLGACSTLAEPSGDPVHDTAIELPWRLRWAPQADGPVHADHRVEALLHDDVAGLWLARLLGPGPALRMAAIDPNAAAAADPFPIPLSTNTRNVIGQQATPPLATRAELSCLGGSLTAGGAWTGLAWSHAATLGRDQSVRVVEEGRLYPWGSRATLVTTVERQPADLVAGGVAALRVERTLTIDEPVVAVGGDRTFPFDAAELLQAQFSGLGAPEPGYSFVRPSPDLAPTQEALDVAKQQLDAALSPLGGELGLPRSIDDLLRSGLQAALDWQDAGAQLAPVSTQLQEAESALVRAHEISEQIDDIQRQIDHMPQVIEGPDGPEPNPALDELNEQIRLLSEELRGLPTVSNAEMTRLRNEVQRLTNAVNAAWAGMQGELAKPRSLWDLVAAGVEGAQAAADLTAEVARLEQLVRELGALQIPVEVFVWPTTSTGDRLRVPVRLHGPSAVQVELPVIFVKEVFLPGVEHAAEYWSFSDPELSGRLTAAWSGSDAGHASVPPTPIDLVRSSSNSPLPEDVQVVLALNLSGAVVGSGSFRPQLGRRADVDGAAEWAMRIALPGVDALTGAAEAAVGEAKSYAVQFAGDFLSHGDDAKLVLDILDTASVDFTKMADRSGGLAAIQVAADGIGRQLGPIQQAALAAIPRPEDLIGPDATLLGFPLRDILGVIDEPPAIVTETLAGRPPTATMTWGDVPLTPVPSLIVHPVNPADTRRSLMVLEVESSVEHVRSHCRVDDFSLTFPPVGETLLQLDIEYLSFTQETKPGQVGKPVIEFGKIDIKFLGPLALLKELQDAVKLATSTSWLDISPSGAVARFDLPIPSVNCGAFSLSNIAFHSSVEVPFDGRPVAVSVGFASRAKPFALSVYAFGGGGYVEVRIDSTGPTIEAALEFGALVSVNFLVATGEVHALGGARYVQRASSVQLTAYLRIGGSVEVLGLVSVSIELVIQLSFDSSRNRLVGRATLVIEIDLTLWSDSLEIDSGEWELVGGSAGVASGATPDSVDDTRAAGRSFDEDADRQAAWLAYLGSFEEDAA